MHIKIWRSKKNHEWYFSIIAGNHKVVAQSEGYLTKRSCMHTANEIRGANFWMIIKEEPCN